MQFLCSIREQARGDTWGACATVSHVDAFACSEGLGARKSAAGGAAPHMLASGNSGALQLNYLSRSILSIWRSPVAARGHGAAAFLIACRDEDRRVGARALRRRLLDMHYKARSIAYRSAAAAQAAARPLLLLPTRS
ncbi:hypothetical protein EVAR_80417_1 [Eumeta japonica]|uniref:Uncharacterized protein n=1 Tax=Eumeta variegata TaxID=151549 RepID=A0A4C1VJN9_EUMVA|nr:hypothetical protein EVAR_80417_1 [Eumeta japonica]